MPLRLSVRQVAMTRTPCRTRLPFRFGATTVTSADLLTCRVTCGTPPGLGIDGWSADLLVPRWFRKDTLATPSEDSDELFASAVAAANACTVRAASARTPFDLWQEVFAERVGSQPGDAPDLLVRGFGCALLERAVLDAACRAAGRSFAEALRADVFGWRPGQVHAELAGWDWQRALPTPSSRLAVRHTVGMQDVLRTRDLAAGQRVDDGLPQSLEQDVATYGLRWLKVKIGAGVAADRARLLDLAAFCAEHDFAPGITLDGNEQFQDLGELANLLDAVAAEPRGQIFHTGDCSDAVQKN